MPDELRISLIVNGAPVVATVAARTTLVDFLRETLGLTGTHVGCAQGVCGACTLRIDGAIARGCLALAVQADGATVETIEGIARSGEIADLQVAFYERNAFQCGFCTSGMLVAAADLVSRGGAPDEAAVREHLSGNLCRCTGYQPIVEAVLAVAAARAEAAR